MTDQQVAENIKSLMKRDGYRMLSVESLAHRWSMYTSEPQIERAVRKVPHLTLRVITGSLWIVAHPIAPNKKHEKAREAEAA